MARVIMDDGTIYEVRNEYAIFAACLENRRKGASENWHEVSVDECWHRADKSLQSLRGSLTLANRTGTAQDALDVALNMSRIYRYTVRDQVAVWENYV